VRQKDKREGLMKRGVISRIGGHCFSDLLIGPASNRLSGKKRQEYVDKLFAEHPEYFPLVRGKRVKISHGGAQPQPCTSHPEVIRRAAKEMVAQYRNAKALGVPCFFSFGNNDTTQWCECENCVAQDPPEERKRGWISTRYWKFLNAVLAEARKEESGILVEGWSYQNYSEPPLGVKPDLRLRSMDISNHRRCWKHLLDDPKCPTNPWYCKYTKVWNDTLLPTVPYAELSHAGYAFLPVEKNWVDNLKLYKKIFKHIDGERTEICCPDGKYNGRFRTYRNLNNWRMMWQTIYMGMVFHWDVEQDFHKVWEEINSLYYGKGWEGGMREFRKLLMKLYMDAPGCWGYGHSVPVGKFLDVPGAKEKLYFFLDSAEKAAALDPDKRALAHVKQDREYFEKTWIASYETYLKNYRDIRALPVTGKIVLDGKLDEEDWKKASVQSNFTLMHKDAPAKCQTAVRICYDAENIYMGIECLEPEMNKILTYVKTHDGPVWGDNDVEIFLNDPMLGGSYFQIIINADGVVCDLLNTGVGKNDRSYESGVRVSTYKGKDRWVLELAVPARKIIGSALAAGQVIKINVA
ncbi:MAG: DUF4838 domain-containing protein, partial [Lentisphaeria bacterium]|nr:DUF4838 domain-containing protein [Lentisphaeria bacterium]